ncbi:MAG TPA: alpha/beta hydrolase, partial [Anaerolineae bacterium]
MLDDATTQVTLEMHSDDAHRLLTALSTEPACVFGSSAGALIGLDLIIGHPEQVRLLIAHEPPVEGLVPDFDQFQADVAGIYQRAGTVAALGKFTSQLGVSYADMEPDVVLPPRNMESITADADAL